MGRPDALPTVSTLGEMEAKMGIPPIEVLLAERDELVREVAQLRARHGAFGTYQDLRKIQLASIAATLRAQAVADERKMTEAAIEEAAHSDPRYADFVTQATNEKAEWAIAENRIQGIEDTIQRANVIARYLAAELHL